VISRQTYLIDRLLGYLSTTDYRDDGVGILRLLDSRAFLQLTGSLRIRLTIMAKNIDHLDTRVSDDIALPSVLSARLQNVMHGPDYDWSGTTDPAKRRKIQNRLHQRAWSKYIHGLRRSLKSTVSNSTLQEGDESSASRPKTQVRNWTLCGRVVDALILRAHRRRTSHR
jgi:hypothetical protein